MGRAGWASKASPAWAAPFRVTVWLDVTERQRPRQPMPVTIAGMRALVIDDNPLAAENYGPQPAGAAVAAGLGGVPGARPSAALERAAAEEPYQVVFLDYWMPEIDGAEAARTIQHGKAGATQPQIVMLTGFAAEPKDQAAELAGIAGFLIKPITLSSLYDMLVQTFAGDGSRLALPQDEAPNLTGIRVLLAEDNEINQQVAVELLTRGGAAVTVANNGCETVDAITGEVQPPPYDIVADGHGDAGDGRARGHARDQV